MSNDVNKSLTIFTDVNVDKNDVVDVAISAIEDRLLNEKEVLQKEITDLNEYRSTRHQDMLKFMQGMAMEEFGERAKNVVTAVKALDKSIDITPTYVGQWIRNPDTGKVAVTLQVVVGRISADKQVQAPSKLMDIIKDIEATTEEIDTAAKRLIEVRIRLTDIDRLIRKAKASLAKIALSKTDNGKKLLEDLEKGIITTDKFLKSLPSA